MKRHYSTVECYLFKDPRFLQLTDKEKLTWQYLLGNSSQVKCPGLVEGSCLTLAQYLYYPLRVTEKDRFNEAIDVSGSCIKKLVSMKWVEHDLQAQLFFLPNAIKHNLPRNRNMLWRWIRQLKEFPSSPLIRRWIKTTADVLTSVFGREDERQKIIVQFSRSLTAASFVDPEQHQIVVEERDDNGNLIESKILEGYYSGYRGGFKDDLASCLFKLEKSRSNPKPPTTKKQKPSQQSLIDPKSQFTSRQKLLWKLFESELFYVKNRGNQTVVQNVTDPVGLCEKLGGEKFSHVDIEGLMLKLSAWSQENRKKARQNLSMFLVSCFSKEESRAKEDRETQQRHDREQTVKRSNLQEFEACDYVEPSEEDKRKRREALIRSGFSPEGSVDA